MPSQLIRHGSEAGYKAERQQGETPCERCANAHRVYGSQYRAAQRAAGIKYKVHDVIDHLYEPSTKSAKSSRVKSSQNRVNSTETPQVSLLESSQTESKPSLRDRVGELLGRAVESDYVTEEPHGFTESDPDPDPVTGDNWTDITDEEFVVTGAMLAKIEENLGTYLSVVGMTAEMIDPYCGAILAQNFENMVKKWTKVIAHYPKAASLFLDGKGGIIFAWIGALQATWPVLMAIYDHHLAHNVRVENGNIQRRTGRDFRPDFDATTPPMPDDFSYPVR